MKYALDGLENRYRDGTLLIVSCGPSARRWREVRSLLPADTIVACIKQAIFLCKREASLHFFNSFNSQRYFPANHKAFRIFVDDVDAPVSLNGSDLIFTLDPKTCGSLTDTVAAVGNFADYTIQKTGLVRPWGPGIMFDAVAYMANFLGFRDIHTIGWDVIAEPESEMIRLKHFYDAPPHVASDLALRFAAAFQSQDRALIKRAIQNVARAGSMSKIARKTGLSRSSLGRFENRARHLFGLPYNQGIDVAGEVPLIRGSLRRFFEWQESEGARFTVHTELNGYSVDSTFGKYVVDHSHAGST